MECLTPISMGMGGAIMDLNDLRFERKLRTHGVAQVHWPLIDEFVSAALHEYQANQNEKTVLFGEREWAELLKLDSDGRRSP